MMKIWRLWILLSMFLLFLGIVLYSSSVYAQQVTPVPALSEELKRKEEEIKVLEKKVADLQSQEKTLSSEIAVMNSQIKLTELRIQATISEITGVTSDINIAEKKIENLEKELTLLTEVVATRIVATYEVGSLRPLQILFSSNGISDFLSRFSYLRIVQANDKRLIFEAQQAKLDYANQKEIFESKKKKIETLKNQLEGYTDQLGLERKNKEALLSVTKNDEKKYQQLLAQLRAEKAAIEGVVATIQLKDGTPIKEGQSIAVVGNSGAPGCSTGPHLHFEVRKNGVIDDPNVHLKSGVSFRYSYEEKDYFLYGTINPRGSWNWPLSETIKINQAYGSHEYARRYSDGIHTGIDMESDSSNLIEAPKDGTLYKGSTYCGSSPMNYVAIDHGEGIISWYWHVY